MDGLDTNDGSELAPFSSPSEAIRKISDLKSKNPKVPVTVILKEGTYYLEEPLLLTAGESGTKDSPTIIRAASGSKVVLSAGKKLMLNWQKSDGNLWEAIVPEGVVFAALFLDGEPKIRARYPDFQEGVLPFGGFAEDALSKERIKSWQDPEGGIIHAMHRGRWGGMHYRILGKDSDGKLEYEGGWQNNRPSDMHPQQRFVENIFEELDQPGEWYLNEKEMVLYYFPEEGQEMGKLAEAEISNLENIITIRGDSQNPVQNIILKDLIFMHTSPSFMKTREQLMRSDWAIYRNGAVLMDGTENCSVNSSVFKHLGGNAIFVSNYNREVCISNNLIEEIGGNAVSFVGNQDAVRSPAFRYEEFVPEEEMDTLPGPKSENYPSNSLVYDNLIRNIGLIEKQVAGVQIQMAMDLTIRHNTIYNVPRAGINIGDGAWGGHFIEYNDVFNTVLESGDHGAFNSWGRDRFWHPDRNVMDQLVSNRPEWIRLDAWKTTVIRNNRFRCDHGWDIDLDDGSSNYEIYNNLCLSGGLKLREGFYRNVHNNILVNNGFHPHVWFQNSGDKFVGNIVMNRHLPIQVNHWGEKVDSNFFTSKTDLERSRQYGIEENGTSGDPMFLAPENGDFRVNASSPAVKSIGFENFDMGQFGVVSESLQKISHKPEFSTLLMEGNNVEGETWEWHGIKVKNMETLGEQSASGMNEVRGVLVLEIPESSATSLMTGDVILESEGDEIRDYFSLLKSEKANNWKGRIQLKIWRNQQLITVLKQL